MNTGLIKFGYDPSISIVVMNDYNKILQRPAPVRISEGNYITDIDETYLVSGSYYEVQWFFCDQIKRFSFIYDNPVIVNNHCDVYGTVKEFGFASVKKPIEMSTVNKHFTTITDIFGKWNLHIPYNNICIISYDNFRKKFKVPNTVSINIDNIPFYSIGVTTDAFGNQTSN